MNVRMPYGFYNLLDMLEPLRRGRDALCIFIEIGHISSVLFSMNKSEIIRENT